MIQWIEIQFINHHSTHYYLLPTSVQHLHHTISDENLQTLIGNVVLSVKQHRSGERVPHLLMGTIKIVQCQLLESTLKAAKKASEYSALT